MLQIKHASHIIIVFVFEDIRAAIKMLFFKSEQRRSTWIWKKIYEMLLSRIVIFLLPPNISHSFVLPTNKYKEHKKMLLKILLFLYILKKGVKRIKERLLIRFVIKIITASFWDQQQKILKCRKFCREDIKYFVKKIVQIWRF